MVMPAQDSLHVQKTFGFFTCLVPLSLKVFLSSCKLYRDREIKKTPRHQAQSTLYFADGGASTKDKILIFSKIERTIARSDC